MLASLFILCAASYTCLIIYLTSARVEIIMNNKLILQYLISYKD